MQMSHLPYGERSHGRPPEQPGHGFGDPEDPYGNPAIPSPHPGPGAPGGYSGQVSSPYRGSLSYERPATYGWRGGSAHQDPSSGPPPRPPGYGDPEYVHPGGHPPARRRSPRTAFSRRARTVLAVVAPLALFAIGGTAYLLLTHGTGRTSTERGSHSAVPSHTAHRAPPTASHLGDLRRYLIAAPSGSHAWSKPLGTDRNLSLRQTARLSANSKARRATLVKDHFTHGAVQCWITANGTWVDVRLYQFGSASDAQNFFKGDAITVAGQSGVNGVPGGRTFADSKPDSDGYISVIAIGVKGDVVFLVDLAEHSPTARLSMSNRLMREQYGKL
jgi:hypothetical protein